MMNTKRLDMEKVKDFVGDFNKHFEDLAKGYKKDAEKIKNHRECFWRMYPEIFDKNEVEMDIEVATTMETESKPTIDREEKLRKVEEKLLSKKTNEMFTRINYEDVINDHNLTLTQKIIYLQKGIDDETRRKILHASLQGKLLEKCFQQSKKVYEELLKEMKIMRQWARFL